MENRVIKETFRGETTRKELLKGSLKISSHKIEFEDGTIIEIKE